MEINKKPLIHCITNPIAMNQSANAVLALGARPIMAEHPSEVAEITAGADGLLLNFGNISDIRIESMKKSIVVANQKDIPVVVDAVGVACSSFRLDFFQELMNLGRATVIKGNYSEILALYDNSYRTTGVDAEGFGNSNHLLAVVESAALAVAEKYHCIVVATGAEDLVADGGQLKKVAGGCQQMSMVTGTGCMLGTIIATFLAFDNSMDAVEKACSFFKECGVKAKTEKGSGTFLVNLMDELCKWQV